MMATVTTMHSKIMEYWKDKFITRNGTVITLEEYETKAYPDAEAVICDWGEPSCWACGEPAKEWREAKYTKWIEEQDYKSIWNSKTVKHNLQRCHIVPGQLGGEDKPENLFLLCPSCHCSSPDTTNPDTFIRWVYRARKDHCCGMPSSERIFANINQELDDRGLPDIVTILRVADFSDKKEEVEKIVNEIGKNISANIGTHGSKLAESSICGAAADEIEKILKVVVSK